MLLDQLRKLRKKIEIYVAYACPGTGKSALTTLTGLVAAEYGVARIGSSDVIRENIERNTELGKEYAKYTDDVAKRKLVPNEPMLLGVQEAILYQYHARKKRKFILDGVPRNYRQGEIILATAVPTKSFELVLPRQIILRQNAERAAFEDRADNGATEEGFRVYDLETMPAVRLYAGRGKEYHDIVYGERSPRDKVAQVLRNMGFEPRKVQNMLNLLEEPGHPAQKKLAEIERRRKEFLQSQGGQVQTGQAKWLPTSKHPAPQAAQMAMA